jgi:DNA helicase-2/ATP-dependent DNA helicase PcrA
MEERAVDLLADLNPSQREAVTHVDGPLLVLAGAGSGKTRVITRRIAYLVDQGVPPWNILAITFTNKAAGEMAERVGRLGVSRGATICTFHSLCVRILRQHAGLIGLDPGFTIYDSDDQRRCLRTAIQQADLSAESFTPAVAQAAISCAKNKLQDAQAFAAAETGFRGRQLARIFRAYQRTLAENHALDFDDLLLRTACLMRDRPDVRNALGQKYLYVLIDEYQDTNHAQYVLAHGIALDHENICATGDPDQSIYAWRGANIRNILEFEQDYPNARVVRLEENYRSRRPILTAASALIARNRERKSKDLIATRGEGPPLEVVRLEDEHAEAAEAAAVVQRLTAEGEIRHADIAVFYRVNAISRVLEEAFRRAAVPYQIARGVEFFNRKEVKDVLAYLRVLVNPADDLSCERIINTPSRGIGATTVGRLREAAAAGGVSLLAACEDPAGAGVGKAPAAKVAAFAKMMTDLAGDLDRPVDEIVADVIHRSGMAVALRDNEEERQARANLDELISSAAEYAEQSDEATLTDFLQMVSLVADVDAVDETAGAVTFMTLHAAKGLEFPVVIIVGCEDGMLPFRREGKECDLEEERRLAFVGITRARERAILTSARYRTLRGAKTRQVDSPFLREIGDEEVERKDKTAPEPTRRRRAVGIESFQRARGGYEGEPADQRRIIEAMEATENVPEEFAGVRSGRRVSSGKFGPGTVRSVSFDGSRTRAVIDFDRAGRKTLILEFARLTPL